jgi:hypothetical protein
MQRVNGGVVAILSFLVATVADAAALSAQPAILKAQFTRTPIVVDGAAEARWGDAPAARIAICMSNDLASRLSDCETRGTVKAMWDGPLLYLLFSIADADVTTTSRTDTNRDGVEIYVDQYNDKFPKFEEDDGRYDSSTGLYVFDLDTGGLVAGTYRIRIDVGDVTTTFTLE